MQSALELKQEELDALEKQLTDNKHARVVLGEEAKELRAKYLEVQEERAQLLKEELQGGAK